MKNLQEQLKSYQILAVIFRDMVRFARGIRGEDFGSRSGFSIAVNHTVSEFARLQKPPEEPLAPFGGQIHRVPKLILRSEPVDRGDIFRLVTFKARDLPKNKEVARFVPRGKRVGMEWKI